jgi:hypothetical protein
MQLFGIETVGKQLYLVQVDDAQKSVIGHFKVDIRFG